MRRCVVTIISSRSSFASSSTSVASSSSSLSTSPPAAIRVAISRPILLLIDSARDFDGERLPDAWSTKPDRGPTDRVSSISKRSLSIVSLRRSCNVGRQSIEAVSVASNVDLHSPASDRRARPAPSEPQRAQSRACRQPVEASRGRAQTAAPGVHVRESPPRTSGCPARHLRRIRAVF